MSMTKAELKKAFREAASYEFRDIPCDDSQIQHTFSPEFEQRIANLIQKENGVLWHFVNTASKRVAAIIIVLVMLFTTAFSVKAIREPLVQFLSEVHKSFTWYFFDGEKTTAITDRYQISVLPDGYIEESAFETDQAINVVYKNEQDYSIHFTQAVTDETNIFMDGEKVNNKAITVGEHEVTLYSQDDILFAMWTHDGYYFEIVCYGNFGEAGIISLIQSVKSK